MKKFLSIVLSVALVLSLFGMNVLAAENDLVNPVTEAGSYDVVGSHGGSGGNPTPSIDDGKSEIPGGAGANAQITVNFHDDNGNGGSGDGTTGNSSIQNRYAIDITFTDLVIDLTNIGRTDTNSDGSITSEEAPADIVYVWDVNKHVYIPHKRGADGKLQPDDSYIPAANKAAVIINNAFYVTNHSDLEIYYTPSLSSVNSLLSMSIRNTLTTEDQAGKTFRVDRATAGTYTNSTTFVEGAATDGMPHNIETIPANDSDWLTVLNNLQSDIENNAQVGLLIITFAETGAGAVDDIISATT
jgi:hypothetical protein